MRSAPVFQLTTWPAGSSRKMAQSVTDVTSRRNSSSVGWPASARSAILESISMGRQILLAAAYAHRCSDRTTSQTPRSGAAAPQYLPRHFARGAAARIRFAQHHVVDVVLVAHRELVAAAGARLEHRAGAGAGSAAAEWRRALEDEHEVARALRREA